MERGKARYAMKIHLDWVHCFGGSSDVVQTCIHHRQNLALTLRKCRSNPFVLNDAICIHVLQLLHKKWHQE